VHHGVYATFTGALPRRSQLWAAALKAGQGPVLSHETAAELVVLLDDPTRRVRHRRRRGLRMYRRSRGDHGTPAGGMDRHAAAVRARLHTR
jgi:hypothetical protein